MKFRAKSSIWPASAAFFLGILLWTGLTLRPAHAGPVETNNFVIDVVEDCGSVHVNPVRPHENLAKSVTPGDTIVVGGTIYPGGTVSPGAQGNLPNDPGSIGQWLSRAAFLVDTAQFGAGLSPIADGTMLYSFSNPNSSLLSEGLVPNVGSSAARAVIGGTGTHSGASGEVRLDNIGTNGTGCFNYRFTFALKSE